MAYCVSVGKWISMWLCNISGTRGWGKPKSAGTGKSSSSEKWGTMERDRGPTTVVKVLLRKKGREIPRVVG